MKTLYIGLAFTGLIGLTACNEGEHLDTELDSNSVDSTQIATENDKKEGDGITYSVPTPNELFDIIKESGAELKTEIVNSLNNEEKYVENGSKALNFGVYSADLGYMSCFDYGIEFIKYVKTTERLGDELGISNVFDQELMDRIEANEENTDSLFNISNDTYFESYQQLEEEGKGAELSLIIGGGYIESLYILTQLVPEYSDSNVLIEKIGDQNLALENIISFCTPYTDNADVESLILDLTDINNSYIDNMDLVESEGQVTDENGVAVISSGNHLEMNQKTFDAVKTKVTEIRTKITQNN